MGEFFKPCRRKIGVLTLVMAILFVVMWVRTTAVTDAIFMVKNNRSTQINNEPWGLTVIFSQEDSQDRVNFTWLYLSLPPGGRLSPQEYQGVRRIGEFVVIKFVEGTLPQDVGSPALKYSAYIIPHWSVFLSLTLVSVWLLLSKPRAPVPKKPAEPIPAEEP